jgi:hypothetical protein
MSDASDRLAQSRLAIIAQIEHREPRPRRSSEAQRPHQRKPEPGEPDDEVNESAGGGWFARIRSAAGTWWRYHPAHMGVELATPALSAYASRKPMQFLGIAAAIGAAVVIARPWRLISITGLLVAIVKSSQLSTVLLSALSAADYQKDHESPG